MPSDTIQRFLFKQDNIRGEWVRLSHSLDEALQAHQYDPRVEQLLIEAITASVLMSSTLKFEGKLILQAQGSGPVTLLAVEATDQRSFRAVARYADPLPKTGDLQAFLGNAQLAITLAPRKGQRYQGIVPMEHARLSDCLAAYFENSEQLHTYLFLAVRGRQALGLILQKLPQADDDSDERWQHLLHLTQTLGVDEALAHENETLLHRLFHEEEVTVYPPEPVNFACSCSRERSQTALEALGQDEALRLLEELSEIEIKCEFCARAYVFDRAAVLQMFDLPPPQ